MCNSCVISVVDCCYVVFIFKPMEKKGDNDCVIHTSILVNSYGRNISKQFIFNRQIK